MGFLLYNTATRSKEEFVPRNASEVGIYCCGPTVYNYAHIGNLRTYIFEDVLKRVLTSLGYSVRHIVNITDVGHLTSDADSGEDKMEAGARRDGRTVWDIASFFTERFMANIKDLNILDADLWPKATDHIPEMIAMVQNLELKGFTYRTSDGIYFDTAKFPAYCSFAQLDPGSLQAGSRVDMGEKRSVTDFALWKFSPTDSKRQMEWESPWGIGFPGWHIECSAMSLKYLNQPIDIHCGGMDHVRVHHTNEIAQVEASTGKPFAQFWAHGEFLTLSDSKMAKSGGNFITLDTVKEQGIDPLAYRLFCFSAHYRSPLTFSWEGLRGAAQGLKRLRLLATEIHVDSVVKPANVTVVHLNNFKKAISDDLNMPQALAAVWDLAQDRDVLPVERKFCLEYMDKILGLDLFRTEETSNVDIKIVQGITVKIESPGNDDALNQKVAELAARRSIARSSRNWGEADAIRNELASLGFDIRDLKDGTVECCPPG
jgi:cysteinyl-tRNA synthetase